MDELKQYLFLNDNFDTIMTEQSKINNLYLGKWSFKWSAIKGIIPYFNKITEEVIDVRRFTISHNESDVSIFRLILCSEIPAICVIALFRQGYFSLCC